jgi:hypothetical protein
MIKRYLIACLAVFLAGTISAWPSKLETAMPLTDSIVLLQFVDGKVYYHNEGNKRSGDSIDNIPLNIEKAVDVKSYKIISEDDPAYQNAFHPVKIGRKSMGHEFTCIWPPVQPHVKKHMLYMILPKPMKRGKKYTVHLQEGLAEGQTRVSFIFDEFTRRSEAIHVNQVGYLPGKKAPKYAYLSQWMGDIGPLDLEKYENNFFYVYDLKDKWPVFVGKVKKRKDFETGSPETKHLEQTPRGQFTGASVWECDFSTCPSRGEFVLVVEGIGSSYPFTIGHDVYREAFYTTCRGLYHERAGIALEEPYTKYAREADHNGAMGYPLYYTKFRFMDSKSEGGNQQEVENMSLGKIPTWGWYHDAGDWDGYPTHMVIPSALMTIFELAPGNFSDGELNIPGSGNGIPDILDEAKWLMDYFRRTRHIARDMGYATGGIPGSRVHGDFFKKPEGASSYKDDRKWYVFGEESYASFKYAALAAQLAYCFDIVGLPDSANTWITEAKEVYEWALENTLPGDKIKNERMMAAAWLFKYTGQKDYHERFLEDNFIKKGDERLPGAGGYNRASHLWAFWAYATTRREEVDKNVQKAIQDAIILLADTANVKTAEKRAYRMGFSWGFPIVVGQQTTPKVLESILAYEITKNPKYFETVSTTADYMLGGNPMNKCWVTGLGDNPPRQLLHIDSWYDEHEEMVPGLVPYGAYNMKSHRGGPGFNGPWDADLGRAVCYPDESQWPGHEMYFENRYCPITNEFTVHQNICIAAAVYGYLCGKAGK